MALASVNRCWRSSIKKLPVAALTCRVVCAHAGNVIRIHKKKWHCVCCLLFRSALSYRIPDHSATWLLFRIHYCPWLHHNHRQMDRPIPAAEWDFWQECHQLLWLVGHRKSVFCCWPPNSYGGHDVHFVPYILIKFSIGGEKPAGWNRQARGAFGSEVKLLMAAQNVDPERNFQKICYFARMPSVLTTEGKISEIREGWGGGGFYPN
jgi:hypothetical protein